MTTDRIQKAIGKMLVLRFHSPVIENIMPFYTYEYDVLSVSKSKMLHEFEVKVSRGDFKTPKEKGKQSLYGKVNAEGRIMGSHGLVIAPNYFSYCCPKDLIKLSEIPDFAGLYYYGDYGDGDTIGEIRKPKRIHGHILQIPIKKIMRYFSERHFLGNCRMTYENNKPVLRYKKPNGKQVELF